MQSRENPRSLSSHNTMNMSIGPIFSQLTIQTLRNLFGLCIAFLCACNSGAAQSKKEQIAVLTTQRDSIQEVMNKCAFQRDSISALLSQSRNQNQSDLEKWQNEKKQLQSKIDEWKQKAELAQMELYATKQQVESLNKRVDSLVLASRAMGELLKPIGSEDNPHLTDDKCSFEGYFYAAKNFLLPEPELMENCYLEEIMPLGWNESGIFAYYTWSTDACGFCWARLNLYKSQLSLESTEYSYEFSLLDEEVLCSKFNQIERDKMEVVTKYSLKSVSELPMHYNRKSSLEIRSINVNAESSNGKGRVILENNGKRTVLREIELSREYSDYWEHWCEEGISINGYFYNPMNLNQVILHCHHTIPCGAEAETYYDAFFLTVPLN
jgi:hypothetical protein